jgi:hypothetical protein
MIFPKIVPNTFSTQEQDTGVYRSELKGTVQVEFEGNVYTVPATRTVGVEIIRASGFLAKGKTGKSYPLSVTYRTKDDEHDCRVGGGVVKIAKVWKE